MPAGCSPPRLDGPPAEESPSEELAPEARVNCVVSDACAEGRRGTGETSRAAAKPDMGSGRRCIGGGCCGGADGSGETRSAWGKLLEGDDPEAEARDELCLLPGDAGTGES